MAVSLQIISLTRPALVFLPVVAVLAILIRWSVSGGTAARYQVTVMCIVFGAAGISTASYLVMLRPRAGEGT